MNYILVDTNGLIVNRVVADADWVPPAGLSLIADNGYDIGGTLIAGNYTPPVRTAPRITFDPFDGWDNISLKISFNHENRIRALENKTPLTPAQFKTAVKAQL